MALTLSGSTGVAGVDGSASTPALQGTDTNSGISFPAADTVAIATAGTERMRIDSAGKAAFTGNVQLPSINDGPLAGFRNAIINGSFDIWQRGTSFSNPGNTAYTADRWTHVFNGTGATRVFSRQTFTLGQTDVPGEPTYFFRFNQSVAGSGGTFNVLSQRVEGVRTFAGQQVTLSFWAKAAASITMPSIQLEQSFGTGGSPSSTVFSLLIGNLVIGTSWTKYAYTITLPSISGKTLGSDNNDQLIVSLALPTNTTFTFDIAQVQLEAGPVATPFERRPIGTELALCQRYYYSVSTAGVSYPFRAVNWSAGNNSAHIGSIHPVVMRAFPTGTIGWQINDVAQGGNPTIFYVSPYYWEMIASVASGSFVDVTNITMSAEL